VLLAPPTVEPSELRGIAGWRRLLTLELPGVDLEVAIGGTTTQAASGSAGLIDTMVDLEPELPPGLVQAVLRVPWREPVTATIHRAAAGAVTGLVCDIDDTVWVARHHPSLAGGAANTDGAQLDPTSGARDGQAAARRHRRCRPSTGDLPEQRALEPGRTGYPVPGSAPVPSGSVLMTDWGFSPQRWFRDGREHKASALDRLAGDFSTVRWVLVGDDGEHDPDIYATFAVAHPAEVAAIALRQVHARPSGATDPEPSTSEQSSSIRGGVPLLHGVDGDEFLPRLRQCLREQDAS
jgi:phosphatidate phosphatase APP1